MKKIIKLFGAAVFMTALFVNLSFNANKTAKNTQLIEFTTDANAVCEENWAGNSDATSDFLRLFNLA